MAGGAVAGEPTPGRYAATDAPSTKDGLGRMCKPHWNQYTNALRRAALARKAAESAPTEPEAVETPEPIRTRGRRASKVLVPAAGSQGDAG